MAQKIQAELELLEIQQEEIERRIARLRQTLIGLAPLCESPNDDPFGMGFRMAMESLSVTDAVRQILQAASTCIAPTEIKQQLLNMGRDLSGQKNVMASIHSLLKRLVESGEIETKDNGLTYQWKAIRRFMRVDINLKADAKRMAFGRKAINQGPPKADDKE